MRLIEFFLKDRAALWLASAVIINGLIAAILTGGLIWKGEPAYEAKIATAPAFSRHWLEVRQMRDSWIPMAKARNRSADDPESGIYSIFFVDKVKFQYPPTSLLVFDLGPSYLRQMDSGDVPKEFLDTLGRISQIAGLIVILVSVLILEIGLRRYQTDCQFTFSVIATRVVIAVMLGFTFYPLIKAHTLGQIQIYLDLLIALAVLFYLLEWRALSGICVGLCVLFKPQFGIILFWGFIRKNWSFVLPMSTIIGSGLAVSLVQFGWDNHIEYIEVLRMLSRHGESYWPNQSINGLFNRFLLNASPFLFDVHAYPPYNNTVYLATLISSFAILAVALWPFWQTKQPREHRLADFLILLVAVTMASPIAWEHHYGILLPICAALLPLALESLPFGRWTGPSLALGFAAVSNILLLPHIFYSNRWWGLIGSHILFGSLVIFTMLLAERSRNLRGAGHAGQPHSNIKAE